VSWFKCSTCRIRRSELDVTLSAAQEECPLCGRALEPESDLMSLMGLRLVTGGGANGEAVISCMPRPR
jgi:hypothetical protein